MGDRESSRSRDIVLAANHFAHIQDATKGDISTYVGPNKVTLSGDDRPVVFDNHTKDFREVSGNDIRQKFVTAPAGWYVVLLNPAPKHPKIGQKNSTPEEMKVGEKVNIPGPCSIALWPGQVAEVIQGHNLNSNQYALIRVYDAEAATKDWEEAKVQEASTEDLGTPDGDASKKTKKDAKEDVKEPSLFSQVPADIANGRCYVVRGTEVSFYIPPSGVKVVRDPETNDFIREAVTLEMLEYAVLKGESGEQTFRHGTAVVFPEPTQRFKVGSNGGKKFRAFELDERKGVFVKVIEDYTDKPETAKFLPESLRETRMVDGDCQFKTGDELFITGEGVIYYPRKEHNLIKYGDEEMHYAIAIPKGQGRYVLNRDGGGISSVKGPKMFLPDPRTEVITTRNLSDRECDLLYPGNDEVLAFHRAERQKSVGTSSDSVASLSARLRSSSGYDPSDDLDMQHNLSRSADKGFGGDSLERSNTFTKPRTVILDTKFQGVVSFNVPTGFAIKIVDEDGNSRVVIGPQPVMLEYGEIFEAMKLSTGKPKTTDRYYETAYLRVHGNKVSDIISCVSSDLVNFKVKLGYRVNFEGKDPSKWFALDNYVKFLCDHARSVIKSAMKRHAVQEVLDNAADLIRDAVLGAKVDDSAREGMVFEENGMKVYDVEVLDVSIQDDVVQDLLFRAQNSNIKRALELSQRKREVADREALEKLNQQEMVAFRGTEVKKHKDGLAILAENTELKEQKLRDADALDALDNDFTRQGEKNQRNIKNVWLRCTKIMSSSFCSSLRSIVVR